MGSLGLFYLAALLVASENVAATSSEQLSGQMDNLFVYDRLFPYPNDNREWETTKQKLLKWYEEVKELQSEFRNATGLQMSEEEKEMFVSKVVSAKQSLEEIFSNFQISKGPVRIFKTDLISHLTKYQDHITKTFADLKGRIVQLRVVTSEPWVYEMGDMRTTEYSIYKEFLDEQFTAALGPLRKPSILKVNAIRFQKVVESTLALIEIEVTSTDNLVKAITSAMTVDGNTTTMGSIEIHPKTLTLEVMPPEEFIVKIETLVNYKKDFADSSTRDYRNLEDDVLRRVIFLLKNPYYGRRDTFLHAKLNKITPGRNDKTDLEIIVTCRNKYDQNGKDIFNNLYRGLQRDRLGTSYLGHTMIRDDFKIFGEKEVKAMLEQQKRFSEEIEQYEEQDKKRSGYFMIITIPFATAILILIFTFMMCVNFRHCCCNLCAPTMNGQVSYKRASSN